MGSERISRAEAVAAATRILRENEAARHAELDHVPDIVDDAIAMQETIDTQAAEIERLGKLIDSKNLIAICPKCNTTYVDHDGFGCCGCDDPEIERLKQPPKVTIAYDDGRIKQACLPGWWITARHHKGETWVEIKPTGVVAAQETKADG